MKAKPLPSFEDVEKRLRYDPDTGIFYHKSRDFRQNRPMKRSVAGNLQENGYIYIGVMGKSYVAHRLAWLLVYKEDPGEFEIDHIDGNRSNNRLLNLRLATHNQNQHNMKLKKTNTSGIKGVSWHNSMQMWRGTITVNKKIKCLGFSHCKFAIGEVVKEYRERMHKEFHNHG